VESASHVFPHTHGTEFGQSSASKVQSSVQLDSVRGKGLGRSF
jgi:hypothetical protein